MSIFKCPATISIHRVGSAAVLTDSPSIADRFVYRTSRPIYLPIPQPASTVIAPVGRPDCDSSENRLRSVGDRSDRLARHFNESAVCRTVHQHPVRRLGWPTGHGTDVGPKSSPL
ncbi:unnamed protein product [Macrosiphum euphorbiae]|uniref:Uncharacterized protein n=1 Tax=Macrosiphum euphorbiae TaxID=13131 RepID=A0AAV0W488_9HEMI|nr:unnamed protein product [Macrosiphum euphorbiae]